MLDDYFATLQPNHADAVCIRSSSFIEYSLVDVMCVCVCARCCLQHHQHPPSRFFSYWVVEYTISFMTIYLNLGFELELYAPDEVAMTHKYEKYQRSST